MQPTMPLPVVDAGEPDPGETENPDTPLCGGTAVEPEIKTEIIPGNVLLVFDKSGSMCEQWSAGPRWQSAYQAVATALDPLKDNATVGAILFPDTPTGDQCSVPQIVSAPQINFTDGPAFLTAWAAYWDTATNDANTCDNDVPNAVNGATPLLGALQAADAALAGAALENTTSIVVITDGQPNCSGGNSRADEPLENLTPIVANWLTTGYKTYVVGLPGLDSDALTLLDGLAMAGGTSQHIPASDPAALQAELSTIIGESVSQTLSCNIGLPNPPPDPEKVHVLVVENGLEQDVARDLGPGGGWALAADGSEIVLQGTLCDLAQQGQYEKISVVFGCVDAPPLEPPVPPS